MTRFLNLFRSSRLEDALDDEIEFHLAYRTEQNLRCGMSREEAEREARDQFGDISKIKAAMRGARLSTLESIAPWAALAVVAFSVVFGAHFLLAPPVVLEVGGDVTSPTPLAMHKPDYTLAARAAKVQGMVRIRCVIDVDGLCRDAVVERSLDRQFGLDEQAVRTTRGWRFSPAMRHGVAVPVRVRIDLQFALR